MSINDIAQITGIIFFSMLITALGFFWLRDPEKATKKHL